MTVDLGRDFVRVVVRDSRGRVLVVVHRTSRRGAMNLPGGKVEHGETPEEAARRELFEETGLILRSLSLVGTETFKIDGRLWRGHFFSGEASGNPKNREPKKLSSVRFREIGTGKGAGARGFFLDPIERDSQLRGLDRQCQILLRLPFS